MKISPITFSRFNNRFIQKQNNISNLKYRILQCDTISFGYLDEEVPTNLQLYRCIGEDEYQKLINGETIESSGYATSDERGWLAKNWHTGFFSQENKNYFITFKPGTLEFHSKRDNENDTRYGIDEEYSLANISNIRKGYHAHGELVWAENLDEAKERDIEHKKSEIKKCIELLKGNYSEAEKAKTIDELSSYGDEFPEISDLFEQYVDYTDKVDVNNLVYLINHICNKKDLPKYRKCLESYVNGVPVKEYGLDFLQYFGDRNDLDKAMQLIDKGVIKSPNKIGAILANLSEEKDYPDIFSKYNTTKPEDLVILSHFIEDKDRTGEHLKDVEDLLLKCDKLRKDFESKKIPSKTRDSLWSTIDVCMGYLTEFGNENSLFVIEPYCEDNPQLVYRHYDAEYAKAKIEKRLNLQ